MISFRNLFHQLHIWLGIASGLVVFIVAITGCMFAFRTEITELTLPFQSVRMEEEAFLTPDVIREKARPYVYTCPADSSHVVSGVTYGNRNRVATVAFTHRTEGYTVLFLNPYTGAYLGKQSQQEDFFRWVLNGHRSLWLPYNTGRPIIGWSVVVFVLVLISGLVIWFPKRVNWKSLANSFKIKGKWGTFRLTYELHKVSGAYLTLFALVLALTGLTWSFKWYSQTYYRILSGGKELKRWEVPQSNTTKADSVSHPGDTLWERMLATYPIGETGSFMFDFPTGETGVYRVCFNPANNGTFYKRHFRFFDQNTLKELPGGGIYGISYADSSTADKIYRMTYDIHVGAIGGITGKILAFLVSLFIASLPVSGWLIFRKKRRKQKG